MIPMRTVFFILAMFAALVLSDFLFFEEFTPLSNAVTALLVGLVDLYFRRREKTSPEGD